MRESYQVDDDQWNIEDYEANPCEEKHGLQKRPRLVNFDVEGADSKEAAEYESVNIQRYKGRP